MFILNKEQYADALKKWPDCVTCAEHASRGETSFVHQDVVYKLGEQEYRFLTGITAIDTLGL